MRPEDMSEIQATLSAQLIKPFIFFPSYSPTVANSRTPFRCGVIQQARASTPPRCGCPVYPLMNQ